jgi:hypothetical protein
MAYGSLSEEDELDDHRLVDGHEPPGPVHEAEAQHPEVLVARRERVAGPEVPVAHDLAVVHVDGDARQDVLGRRAALERPVVREARGQVDLAVGRHVDVARERAGPRSELGEGRRAGR